ncbi:MAG: redoxin domain-containing protein, partial [Pseudomonadota bacterium]
MNKSALLLVLAAIFLAPYSSGASVTEARDLQDIVGTRVVDVHGTVHRLGVSNGQVDAVALVFLDNACPVATRYVPELNSLADTAAASGVKLYGVLSNPAIGWRDARTFATEYGAQFPIVFDSAGDLYLRLRPSVFAEAFLIGTNNQLLYRGRIDNRFAAIGKLRNQVTSHDLRDQITRLATTDERALQTTDAVGCFHPNWSDMTRAALTSADVNYERHIAPILTANCVECHRAGGVAPFALDDLTSAQRWGRMIAYMTEERLMPPWRAVAAFGNFRDSRVLSEHQIALLAAWVDDGSPAGDNADPMPPILSQESNWRLGSPDQILQMVEPFKVPAKGEDVYRYFVIPNPFPNDVVIKALEFKPGDTGVVHHANYLMDFSGRAQTEDRKDDEPGFSVFGTGGFIDYNSWGIGGWTPGADPYVLGKDTGMWIPAGGDLVLEIH